MGIIFLILSFVFIFSFFFVTYEKKEKVFSNFRLAFVKASLIVSVMVAIFTDFFSFFSILTASNIILAWLAVTIISVVVLIFSVKKYNYPLKKISYSKAMYFLRNEGIATKIHILLIAVILVSLFFVAFTTTNNWDSYTYHLPKVEHWIQDRNVDFYPTNNVRQLYLAPFSEYFILNVRLLSGNALFINFIQFFALINCVLVASLIAKLLILPHRGQITAFILALTIPMGILQATTTQTELVVAFFLVAFVYFLISIAKNKNFSSGDLFFLSASFALGILTKSTFYIFAFPFCLLFGIYFIKIFKFRSAVIASFVIAMFLLLNTPFLARNYSQFRSPLGPQKSAPYYLANLNEDFGLRTMLSNSVKNAGLHLALPNNTWNSFVDKNVHFVHDYFIKFPANYEKTNWFNTVYKTVFVVHHDLVGNFAHIVLFFIAILITIFKFKNISRLVKIYGVTILFTFLLFAFLLKWQPWQTRLDLPIFILIAPFVAYALSLNRRKTLSNIICVSLLIITVSILFIYDPIKPILGKNSIFLKNNSAYIFEYESSVKIKSILEAGDVSNVGLILGGNSWEWQYWLLLKNVRFEYIYFNEDFLKTPNYDKYFGYNAIIVENDQLAKPDVKNLVYDKNSGILDAININDKITLIIYEEKQRNITTYGGTNK